MKISKSKIGERYGKLIIISEVEPTACSNGQRRRKFLCKCDCGKEKIVSFPNLCSGNTTSCGCNYKEAAKLRSKYNQGLLNSKLYGVWAAMKQRCYDPNKEHFDCYGGRGITVCNEWKDDFLVFYNWAINNGYQEGLTIDRIDVNGNYEPNNCRWIDNKQQANNKRTNVFLTLNGECHTIMEWSEKLGINAGTLQQRKHLGWSDEDILTRPVYKYNYHKKCNGKSPVLLLDENDNIVSEYSSIKEAAEANGLKYNSVSCYLRGVQKDCFGYKFKYKD